MLPLFSVLLVLLLPLAGARLAGLPVAPFLEFPPKTLHVFHARFSWTVFTAIAAFTTLAVVPFVVHGLRFHSVRSSSDPFPCGTSHPPFGPLPWQTSQPPFGPLPWQTSQPPFGPLPWWGWGGFALAGVAWVLAWNRFPWVGAFQSHTFTPLWLGYILGINALAFRRRGTCLMLRCPARFLALFAASAAFWWVFEWLNRFVQNWRYVGGEHFSPWEYFWYATLPFSTVLPAVLSTRELLESFPRLTEPFRALRAVNLPHPATAWAVLAISALALLLLGVFPNALFPALWLAPLGILLATQALSARPHALSPVGRGDWSGVVTAALAALACGFFWEMWNSSSLLKWEYAVPFVHRFLLFEMPLAGWAGYLPFGLECVAVASLFGLDDLPLPSSNADS